jgi:hypothetical protein
VAVVHRLALEGAYAYRPGGSPVNISASPQDGWTPMHRMAHRVPPSASGKSGRLGRTACPKTDALFTELLAFPQSELLSLLVCVWLRRSVL